jgi:calcineurin-like phosphoesterase family protein
MDFMMAKNWNQCIAPDDEVYFLGDFAFYKEKESARRLLSTLHGRKYLIVGNHDNRKTKSKWIEAGFSLVDDALIIELSSGRYVFLMHNPNWNGWPDYPNISVCDLWKLHGHVHDKWTIKKGLLNVGVDVHSFSPISETTVEMMIGVYEKDHVAQYTYPI